MVTLAGELLGAAESLLRDGLHPAEVIQGYTKAAASVLASLEELVLPGSEKIDPRDAVAVALRLKACIASKQFGQEGLLAPLVAEACVAVTPTNAANFSIDDVRVAKIVGGGLADSKARGGEGGEGGGSGRGGGESAGRRPPPRGTSTCWRGGGCSPEQGRGAAQRNGRYGSARSSARHLGPRRPS